MNTAGQDESELNLKSPWVKLLYPLPFLLFLLVWHLCTGNDPQKQFIFSSPEKVWQALLRLIESGELWTNSLVTISEALAGFLLGTTIGAVLGLALW